MSLHFLTSPVLNKELQTVTEEFKHRAGHFYSKDWCQRRRGRADTVDVGSCVPICAVPNESHTVPGNLQAALHPLSLSLAPPSSEYQEQEHCTLCYVIKEALHTHRGAQSGNSKMGNPNNTLPCLLTYRSHQPIRGLPPKAQRSTGAQRQLGTEIRDSEEGKSCPERLQGCPRKGSAPQSRHETCQKESVSEHPWNQGGPCH